MLEVEQGVVGLGDPITLTNGIRAKVRDAWKANFLWLEATPTDFFVREKRSGGRAWRVSWATYLELSRNIGK